MGYSRRTSNYPERIALLSQTHMMSTTEDIVGEHFDNVTEDTLEKEFTELIRINP